MSKNFDKFTHWLAENHIVVYICLMVTAIVMIGGVVLTSIFFFPYLLILVPILTICYTIHLYRKGDWK